MRIFVYGTLMKEMANEHFLYRARFVRRAKTALGFTLHDLGAYPAMTRKGEGTVIGEVYEIDDETLKALDRLEGHPRFYRRTKIALSDEEAEEAIETYLMPIERASRYPTVPKGDWRQHVYKRSEP